MLPVVHSMKCLRKVDVVNRMITLLLAKYHHKSIMMKTVVVYQYSVFRFKSSGKGIYIDFIISNFTIQDIYQKPVKVIVELYIGIFYTTCCASFCVTCTIVFLDTTLFVPYYLPLPFSLSIAYCLLTPFCFSPVPLC